MFVFAVRKVVTNSRSTCNLLLGEWPVVCANRKQVLSKRIHEYIDKCNSCIVKTVYGSSSGCVLCLDYSWCLC